LPICGIANQRENPTANDARETDSQLSGIGKHSGEQERARNLQDHRPKKDDTKSSLESGISNGRRRKREKVIG